MLKVVWLFIALLLGVLTALIILTHDAAAATPQQQPVVGYAYTDTCVISEGAAKVHFVFTNRSNTPRTLIVRQYGLTPATPESQKGPMAYIDPKRSGLTPGTEPGLWYWVVKLGPGQTLTKTTFITKTSPRWDTPEQWDPAWGPKPLPRFYYGATASVRNSTVEFYPTVSPTYC